MNNNFDDKDRKIPSLPDALYKDQNDNATYLSDSIPPFLSTTEAIVVNKTNSFGSDPYFVRSTMYNVPTSEYILESSHIPFGVLITPFHEKGTIEDYEEGLMETPSKNYLEKWNERCKHCRSFLNLFTTSKCNICNTTLEKSNDRFKNATFDIIDYKNVDKIDSKNFEKINSKNFDKIDYKNFDKINSKKFEKIKPTFVFIVDMSFGNLNEICENITKIFSEEEFKFFYENVVFIILNRGIEIVSFDKDIFILKLFTEKVPKICHKSFIDSKILSENIKRITNYILNSKFQGITKTEKILTIISDINKISLGTQILIFSDQENNINYEEFLENNTNTVINLVLHKKEKNNLLKLSFYTNGRIIRFSNVNNDYKNDHKIEQKIIDQKFYNQIYNICCTKSVFNVDVLFKPSGNLIKTGTVCSSIEDSPSRVHMNGMNSFSTISYKLGLSDIDSNEKFFQIEISYTDFDGTQRIRVFNNRLCCNNNTYSGISVDTLFALMIKEQIANKVDAHSSLIYMLSQYRKKAKGSTNQLILPESIKILPVLIQSVLKMHNIDKFYIIGGSVEQIMKYFYPKIFSLSEFFISNNIDYLKGIRLGIKNFTENEIYVMENSKEIRIYFKNFEFNNGNVNGNDNGNNEVSLFINKAITLIEQHYNYKLPSKVIKSGSINEAEFLVELIEDNINDKQSYLEYIYEIHEKIKET